MLPVLVNLAAPLAFVDDLRTNVTRFLLHHDHPKTVAHSLRVANAAQRLAQRFEQNVAAAECAALLHDISAVIPNHERIAVAEQCGLEILAEERTLPMIIHQKLSAFIARELFGVESSAILSAIGCHTTLKAHATPLDKVVFVADKIAWDQAGDPPYLAEIVAAAEHSLDAAAWCYLDYLWQRRDSLVVVHPWLTAAHRELGLHHDL